MISNNHNSKKIIMECLPNEVLVKILGYLSSIDLINFCEAFKHFNYFLTDKYVTRYSDWSRKFELHDINICRLISKKMNPSFIKILNINGLYWIPLKDLKILMKDLTNLEELYALDTKLGIFDILNSEYLNLRKLGICVEDHHFLKAEVKKKLIFNLKYLYLKIHSEKKQNQPLLSNLLMSKSFQLEELWVQDLTEWDRQTAHIDIENIMKLNFNLKKVLIRPKTSSVIPYQNHRSKEMIYERGSRDQVPLFASRTDAERASDLLWSFQEERLLHIKELNAPLICSQELHEKFLEVLKAPKIKEMKRIKFQSCTWQRKKIEKKEEQDDYTIPFKRRREVQIESADVHPLQEIIKNLKCLEELVVADNGCTIHNGIPVYELVSTLVNLKKLSLYIPMTFDGKCLKEVFSKCKKLEILEIKIKSTNEIFMINLYDNLKLVTTLQHFKLVCVGVQIDDLLKSLGRIGSKKLLRITVICDVMRFSTSKTQPFSEFLESNPQLMLFYLAALNNTRTDVVDINRTLRKFLKGKPWRVYLAKNKIVFNDVPPAHYDMICATYELGKIDFDRF